jgi:hypothetical protein
MVRPVFFALCLLCFFSSVYGQRIAVLSPDENAQNENLQNLLSRKLSENHKITNGDLAKSVFQSFNFETPFNLSTEESRNFGNAVGDEYFLLLKSANLRRASLSKSEYYESYLAVYLVSTRTGRLVFWTLKSYEAENPTEAEVKLFAALDSLANEISTKIAVAGKTEANEIVAAIEELPAEKSKEAENFRSPLPYKRIRPAYTRIAGLYNVTATVDAIVDLDENGKVSRIEISRWAGYELDESVIKTINEMQWRAAERNGKPLPIRVLLRYNFKKIEKEE